MRKKKTPEELAREAEAEEEDDFTSKTGSDTQAPPRHALCSVFCVRSVLCCAVLCCHVLMCAICNAPPGADAGAGAWIP